jgi:hypothetical protein
VVDVDRHAGEERRGDESPRRRSGHESRYGNKGDHARRQMRRLIDQRIGKVARGANKLAPKKVHSDDRPGEGARQSYVKPAKKQAEQDSSAPGIAQAVS